MPTKNRRPVCFDCKKPLDPFFRAGSRCRPCARAHSTEYFASDAGREWSRDYNRKRYAEHAPTRFKARCRAALTKILDDRRHGRTSNRGRWLLDAMNTSRESFIDHIDRLLRLQSLEWSSYGTEWTIDHRICLATFPHLDSIEDPVFRILWNLDNIRPLRTELHIKKSALESPCNHIDAIHVDSSILFPTMNGANP